MISLRLSKQMLDGRRWLAVLVWLCAFNLFGHAAFDCSTRVVVNPGEVVVMVAAGPELAAGFLRDSGLEARAMGAMQRPVTLPLGMATNFFRVAVDGKMLSPQAVSVLTDGLEFEFEVSYPVHSARSLVFHVNFLSRLLPPQNCPLIVSDENRNVFGTAVLTLAKESAEFNLPASLFPAPEQTNTAMVVTMPEVAGPAVVTSQRAGFKDFLRLGIEHILHGHDHLLFLCVLLLGCRRLKPMLLVITGFTLAHSVTLALAALDVVVLPARVVEPLIALSIVIVAAENFRSDEKSWHRYALTCGFGLIHGFGFASALRETGLASGSAGLVVPLVSFNLGVEVGQLAMVVAVLPGLLLARRWPRFEQLAIRVVSGGVILVAAYWVWVRLTSLGD